MAATEARSGGVYCATAGETFHDKDALASHYKSDFHRYNLKRKIAGLPPVTREWFEARKEQLLGAEAAPATQTWLDPLTRKRFGSENTYLAHVNSRRYKEAVARSGAPAPPPVVTLRRPSAAPAEGGETESQPSTRLPLPYTVKAANGVENHTRRQNGGAEEEDEDSGWETASDQGEDEPPGVAPGGAGASRGGGRASSATTQASHAATKGSSEGPTSPRGQAAEVASPGAEDGEGPAGKPWDPRVSLFDNHRSASLEANLEHMWRRFGFYFPDAEFLADPQGLLAYLGAKLQQGGIPLYVSGLSPTARRFGSLHAVQRHMQDVGRCKMLWEGNEEEYEEYYDYSSLDGDAAAPAGEEDGEPATSSALAVQDDGGPLGGPPRRTQGYELAVAPSGDAPSGAAASGKLLGSREFARYYKQRYRPRDTRLSVATNTVLDRYRALGIKTRDEPSVEEKRVQRAQRGLSRLALNTQLRGNVNKNLPRNCVH